jgi:predicted phage terminase large subunit-like protein
MFIRHLPTAHHGLTMPQVFIADYVRGQWEATERNNRIVSTAVGDGEIMVGVEAFGGYKDAYTTIKSILAGIRHVYKSNLPGDKIAKSESLSPVMEAGNVYFRQAEWNESVINQFQNFPGGKHDDDIDSAVVAFDILNKNKETEWS